MTVAEVIDKINGIQGLIDRIDDGRVSEYWKDDQGLAMDYLAEYKELLENMKVINK